MEWMKIWAEHVNSCWCLKHEQNLHWLLYWQHFSLVPLWLDMIRLMKLVSDSSEHHGGRDNCSGTAQFKSQYQFIVELVWGCQHKHDNSVEIQQPEGKIFWCVCVQSGWRAPECDLFIQSWYTNRINTRAHNNLSPYHLPPCTFILMEITTANLATHLTPPRMFQHALTLSAIFSWDSLSPDHLHKWASCICYLSIIYHHTVHSRTFTNMISSPFLAWPPCFSLQSMFWVIFLPCSRDCFNCLGTGLHQLTRSNAQRTSHQMANWNNCDWIGPSAWLNTVSDWLRAGLNPGSGSVLQWTAAFGTTSTTLRPGLKACQQNLLYCISPYFTVSSPSASAVPHKGGQILTSKNCFCKSIFLEHYVKESAKSRQAQSVAGCHFKETVFCFFFGGGGTNCFLRT